MTALFDSPAPQSLGEHIARLTAIEAAADTVFVWAPLVIPGLLQGFAYAAAILHGTVPSLPLDVVDERAAARRQRLDRLGRPGARTVTVVVDETALYRPIGGYAALVDTLEHIQAVEALQPSLTVRVLPQGGEAHPGLAGPFTLYRAARQKAVLVEALTSSAISTRAEDVAAYSSARDRLLNLAMPARESVELIDGTREVLCRRLKAER